MSTHELESMDVKVFPNPDELGRAAAGDIAACLRTLQRRPGPIRMLFAAAPSQQATLSALVSESGIDWPRIEAFHLDEYVGLDAKAPQRFGNWLRRVLFDHVAVGVFHAIDAIDADVEPEAEAARYGSLLTAAPVDIVILGIGVNGHLAFNDPPADLADPEAARVVVLDDLSRRQQVDDGLFASVEDVPRRAITITIPAILAARRVFCLVSGRHKAAAVGAALHEKIDGAVPASALRTHPEVRLYLDREGAAYV